METELQELVEQGYSLRQIATALGKSQSSIRYWLKKYGFKTKRGPRGKLPKDWKLIRCCKVCKETDPAKFYGNKRYICRTCHNADNLKRGQDKRRKAVKHLGGCCSYCSFNKYDSALDIHHVDTSKKDPNFKTMRYWSWKRIEKELQYCILLCKNCHAAVHSKELNIDGA